MRGREHVLTTRGRAFVAAGVTLALGGMLLGFADLTRIGVLLTALPLAALLISRRRPPSIAIGRTISPTRIRLDERADVRVNFQNRGTRRSPLFLAEEHLDYVLGDRPRFVLPRLDPGAGRLLTYSVRSQVRGRHLLGPIALRQRDPFGLTHVAMVLRSTTDVLVLPRIENLGDAVPRGEGLGSEGEIPHLVSTHGEDDVSIRPYRQGDELRRVHWAATAHRGEIMVRQEDRPSRRRAVLLLDSRQRAHVGSGSASSYEWAVSAMASIVVQLSNQGYAVHLVSAETISDGSANQPVDVQATLGSLALAQLGASDRFEDVIRTAHLLTSSGGVVIAVVADHDQDALRRLATVRQPGTVGLALVLDTDSFGARPTATAGASTLGITMALGTAGWDTHTVRRGQSVRSAWAQAVGVDARERIGSRP